MRFQGQVLPQKRGKFWPEKGKKRQKGLCWCLRGLTPSIRLGRLDFCPWHLGSNLSPLDLKVYPLDLPDLFKGFRGKVAP